jgi:hypothetical protein
MILNLRPIHLIGMTIAAGLVSGQTQVDLRTQTKDVDFSTSASTRPVKTGSALPSVCSVGDLFFSITARAGANLLLCAAANAWTPSGEAIPSNTLSNLPSTCAVGALSYVTDASSVTGGWPLYVCSSANIWTQAEVTADGSGYLTVTCAAPSNCLVGPNTAVAASLPGLNVWTGANDFSGASKTAMFRLAASDPAVCDATAHEAYFNTTSNTVSFCTSTNTWTAVGPQRSFALHKNTSVAALTANGSTQTLDSFVIPAGTLQVGDVLEIEANFIRTGSAAAITFGVTFGSSSIPTGGVSTPVSSTAAVYKPTLVVAGSASQVWGGSVFSTGVTPFPVFSASSAATAAIASPITVSLTQHGTGPDSGAVSSWFVKVTR